MMKKIFTLLLALALILPAISQEPAVPEENKAEEAAKAAKAAEASDLKHLKRALKFLRKMLLIKRLMKPLESPQRNGMEILPMS